MARTSSDAAERICLALRQEIEGGHYGEGDALPSENELARRHQVSRFHARKALTRLEELGLVVNRPGAGRQLARRARKVKRLGLLVLLDYEHIDHWAAEDLPEHVRGWQAGIHQACEELGVFSFFVLKTVHDVSEAMATFRETLPGGVDALVIRSDLRGRDRASFIQAVRNQEVPCLFYGNLSGLDGCSYFEGDDYAAGMLMAKHLVALGHREIGHITSDFAQDFCYYRYRGFVDTLTAAGLSLRDAVLHKRAGVCRRDQDWVDLGRAGVEAFRLSGELGRLSAIHCVNDACAAGALAALRDHGLDVPGDISVTGFDNDSRYGHDLTTGRFPFARRCRDITINFIKHVDEGVAGAFHELVAPELTPGKTVKQAKGGAS